MDDHIELTPCSYAEEGCQKTATWELRYRGLRIINHVCDEHHAVEMATHPNAYREATHRPEGILRADGVIHRELPTEGGS
jgi:hypothetical protein